MSFWDRRGDVVLDKRLASQPTQSRLLRILTSNTKNLRALQIGLGDSVRRHVLSSLYRVVRQATIDIDSFPIEVRGEQTGAAYNGHYRRTVYHPLLASFCVGGDYDSTREGLRLGNGFIHAMLRQGQVHTADGMTRFLDQTHQQALRLARHIDYRLDAGYTVGAVLDRMTDMKRRIVGRLKSNPVLIGMVEIHLKRPPGRPPAEGYENIVELAKYQAQQWQHSQRLILVVIDKPDRETGHLDLFPRFFFLVTNWSEKQRSAEALLEHYRRRGTLEDRLGEFHQAIGVHLSSPNCKENEATFFLALLAYNLATICRNEIEDAVGGCWDLRRFQHFLLRVGGLCIKKSRRLWSCASLNRQNHCGACWWRTWRAGSCPMSGHVPPLPPSASRPLPITLTWKLSFARSTFCSLSTSNSALGEGGLVRLHRDRAPRAGRSPVP